MGPSEAEGQTLKEEAPDETPGLLPAHAKEKDDGRENHHHFLITTVRV
jgi:hypothetical protein